MEYNLRICGIGANNFKTPILPQYDELIFCLGFVNKLFAVTGRL